MRQLGGTLRLILRRASLKRRDGARIWARKESVLSDPQVWVSLVTLTALEVVLSVDNRS